MTAIDPLERFQRDEADLRRTLAAAQAQVEAAEYQYATQVFLQSPDQRLMTKLLSERGRAVDVVDSTKSALAVSEAIRQRAQTASATQGWDAAFAARREVYVKAKAEVAKLAKLVDEILAVQKRIGDLENADWELANAQGQANAAGGLGRPVSQRLMGCSLAFVGGDLTRELADAQRQLASTGEREGR